MMWFILWFVVWLIGSILTYIGITLWEAHDNGTPFIIFLHDTEDEAEFIAFLGSILWPIIVPFLVMLWVLGKLADNLRYVGFNPIRSFLKMITGRKYIREKVMEEI